MHEFIEHNNFIVIKSDKYQATLSKEKGGTMTALSVEGINTGLKREGCEYWSDEKTHYEQEFGKIEHIEKNVRPSDEIFISIISSLASPKGRAFGGKCQVEWSFFPDGKIVTKGKIIPAHDCSRYDKYVCFQPGSFSQYILNGTKKNMDIRKPHAGEVWWEKYYRDNNGMTFLNNDITLNFIFDEKLHRGGIHQSKSMLEIKYQDDQKRYDEFSSLTIFGEVVK